MESSTQPGIQSAVAPCPAQDGGDGGVEEVPYQSGEATDFFIFPHFATRQCVC